MKPHIRMLLAWAELSVPAGNQADVLSWSQQERPDRSIPRTSENVATTVTGR